MPNIRIRTKSGEVIDLAEARTAAMAALRNHLGQNAAGVPAARCICARCEIASHAIALLDALESALSVPKDTEDTPNMLTEEIRHSYNRAIKAVRQAAGVIEEDLFSDCGRNMDRGEPHTAECASALAWDRDEEREIIVVAKVHCPQCGAEPGAECDSRSVGTHTVRYTAYDAHRAANEVPAHE